MGYEGTHSLDTKRFLVVGVRNKDADDYHLYITNLPREEFFPTDVAELYRCRWDVERLFRELKTQYELDEFETSKPHVVKILLYAAMLSLVMSRDLESLVTEEVVDGIVFPPERWAATFRSHAQLILNELGEYLGTHRRTSRPGDRRYSEGLPTTTDLTRDARYRYATEV